MVHIGTGRESFWTLYVTDMRRDRQTDRLLIVWKNFIERQTDSHLMAYAYIVYDRGCLTLNLPDSFFFSLL